MKLDYEITEVSSSGMGRTQNFTIGITPESFKILSADLYSDPIRAVVREISCNAVDAHIASGNPNPIRISLPNALNPQFEVEDNGLGLSEDDVFDVFMGYFTSTKRGKDNETGGFGLGCKSPFAYADAFTVESRYNGMKSTYVFTTGEIGVPTGSKVGEVPFDGPNGVRVAVPVKRGDYSLFHTACLKVAPWLSRPAVVSGSGNPIMFETPTPTFASGGISVYNETPTLLARIAIRYLGVTYQFPDSYLSDKLFSSVLSIVGISRYAYQGKHVVFELPPGCGVRPNPNRESLQESDTLRAALTAVATTFKKDFEAHLEGELAKFDTPVEAVRYWLEQSFFGVNPKYRGIGIEELKNEVRYCSLPTTGLLIRHFNYRRVAQSENNGQHYRIDATSHILILQDTPTRRLKDIRHWLSQQQGKVFGHWILGDSEDKTLTQDRLDAILYFFAGAKIIRASEIDLAPKVKREKKPPSEKIVGYLPGGNKVDLEIASESRMVYYQGEDGIDIHAATAVCDFMGWPHPVRVYKKDLASLPEDRFPRISSLDIAGMVAKCEAEDRKRAAWYTLVQWAKNNHLLEIEPHLTKDSELGILIRQIKPHMGDPAPKVWPSCGYADKIIRYIDRKYPLASLADSLEYYIERSSPMHQRMAKIKEIIIFNCRDVDSGRSL